MEHEVRRPSDDDPVQALQKDINRAFDDFLRMFPVPFSGWPSSGWPVSGWPVSGWPVSGWPATLMENADGVQVDLVETDKEVRVTAELPGMEEGDIDVRVSDGMLTISGEKKLDRETDEKGYTLRERRFGRVERVLPLPEGVDADAAQAAFRSGVLTVTIPKTSQAQGSAKRILVQSR
jgi:HSP20 family protein